MAVVAVVKFVIVIDSQRGIIRHGAGGGEIATIDRMKSIDRINRIWRINRIKTKKKANSL